LESSNETALILIMLLSAVVALAQENHRRIGEIDFYGYAGLDLDKVRSALPFREGDNFTDSDNAFFDAVDRIETKRAFCWMN